MDEILMIPDLAWIPRGAAKKIPDKLKLDKEQLEELIQGILTLVDVCRHFLGPVDNDGGSDTEVAEDTMETEENVKDEDEKAEDDTERNA